MNTIENTEPVVSIGIDAAVVAAHQVAIRGPGITEDFRGPADVGRVGRVDGPVG